MVGLFILFLFFIFNLSVLFTAILVYINNGTVRGVTMENYDKKELIVTIITLTLLSLVLFIIISKGSELTYLFYMRGIF